MMNIYTTSITFLQAISMIKRGESHHAYLNNARDNKWALSIQSTTSGKTEEKHHKRKYLGCWPRWKAKKTPSKSSDTYSYRAALLHLNKNVFGTEHVYRKAKLTGHIKMTWQDSERWLSGQNALWIAVFNWTYMQTWQMFNSLKESGEKKAIFWETLWRWHVNARLFYYLLE